MSFPLTFALPFSNASGFSSRRSGKPFVLHQQRAAPSLIVMTASRAPSEIIRSKILQAGIDAAMDDFVQSGINIAVGGGDPADTDMLVQALSTRAETGAFVDVAFVPVSPAAIKAANNFNLPKDMSVNYSQKIDLFIAPVKQMDHDLHAALGGSANMRTERYISSFAEKTALIIREDDYAATSDGLKHFPVLLDPVLPDQAAASIGTNPLLAEIGVRGIVVRDDRLNIADVLLAPGADLLTIDQAIGALAGIHAVGILPATDKVVAVVSSEDQCYDITSSLARIVELADPSKALVRLSGEELTEKVRKLGAGWEVSSDGRESIKREFRFSSAEQTSMFVAHVLRIAKFANSFPDVMTTFNRVHVRLSTLESHGVTDLDISCARELGQICGRLQGCSM